MTSPWVLSLVAALGQMVVAVVLYYLGRSALDWSWVRRKVERPKAQERLDRWRTRTHQRPVLAGALVVISAVSGIPPFTVIAVAMGQLRMNLVEFLALGLLGRWARLAFVLSGAEWLAHTFL